MPIIEIARCHLAPLRECAGIWIIELCVSTSSIKGASDQDRSVGKEGGGVARTGRCHVAGGSECARIRIIEFGTAKVLLIPSAAGNQYLAVGEEGGGVLGTGRCHVACAVELAWRLCECNWSVAG